MCTHGGRFNDILESHNTHVSPIFKEFTENRFAGRATLKFFVKYYFSAQRLRFRYFNGFVIYRHLTKHFLESSIITSATLKDV